MNYLIDTHVLIWWLANDSRLSQEVRDILTYKPVFCSVVSLWEVILKAQAGKIKVEDSFINEAKGQGFAWMEVQVNHISALEQLPEFHKDPFDRLLIAQAQAESLILITADKYIRKYNVPILRPC
jgi:PIN domain nuclease of toxin-antitoxin system